jgi:methylated-DNA-[protein]-cysteine S-methyltransferase
MNLFTSYYSSPVGLLQLQCSDKYIKSVFFVDEENTSVQEHKLLQTCKKQLDEYFKGKRKVFHLPLNQEGTEFQNAIWKLLYQIPYGKTISYQPACIAIWRCKSNTCRCRCKWKKQNCHHHSLPQGYRYQSIFSWLRRWFKQKKWLLQHEAKYALGVQQFPFSTSELS